MKNPTANAALLVRCSATEAFDSFVDPAKITQFWLQSASAPLAKDARVTWDFMVPGATETVHVIEFDAPSRVAFDWSDGLHVTLDCKAIQAGETVVSVEVSGFTGDDACKQAIAATEGFSIVLCDLKTLLETGRSANLVRDKARLIASKSDA